MTASSKKPVDAVMKSFVDQTGAPLIHSSDVCKDVVHDVTVKQERLTQKGQEVAETWTLPICPKDMLCAVVSEPSRQLSVPNCNRPLFLNRNGSGYFVTDYSADERRMLQTHLRDLTASERIAFRATEALLVNLLRRDVGDYLALLQAMPRPAER